MKHALIGIGLVLVIVAGASLFPGRAQEASQTGQQPPANGALPLNPLKIALLKWYPANLATSFKVGKNPYGIAFDGANMWVTNNSDNTVSKLRASDGATLGTFTVGDSPIGVAFDGANIWVVNSFPNTVSKLRASDGANLGEFAVGKVPFFAAFDGEAIWVTNARRLGQQAAGQRWQSAGHVPRPRGADRHHLRRGLHVGHELRWQCKPVQAGWEASGDLQGDDGRPAHSGL